MGLPVQAPNSNYLFGLPDGVEGIRATLSIMARLVKSFRANPEFIAFTHAVLQGVAPKDDRGEIERIFAYVRDRIIYRKDPVDVEALRAPDVLIRDGHGDCDDKATLLAAMLEAVGYDARFVVIGFQPDDFTHVYVEVRFGPGWMPLDSTESVPAGWSPYDGGRPIRARMNWHI